MEVPPGLGVSGAFSCSWQRLGGLCMELGYLCLRRPFPPALWFILSLDVRLLWWMFQIHVLDSIWINTCFLLLSNSGSQKRDSGY